MNKRQMFYSLLFIVMFIVTFEMLGIMGCKVALLWSGFGLLGDWILGKD